MIFVCEKLSGANLLTKHFWHNSASLPGRILNKNEHKQIYNSLRLFGSIVHFLCKPIKSQPTINQTQTTRNQQPIKNQSATNQTPIKKPSKTNQTPIKNQSNTNQKPVKHQSKTNPKPIETQSKTNQQPIKHQSKTNKQPPTTNQQPINTTTETRSKNPVNNKSTTNQKRGPATSPNCVRIVVISIVKKCPGQLFVFWPATIFKQQYSKSTYNYTEIQ